jgi:dCTP deaminase
MLNGQQISRYVHGLASERQIQPASVDLRIGDQYVRPEYSTTVVVGQDPGPTVGKPFRDDGLILRPGDFILGTTIETVTIPITHCGYLEGKSSLARIGLIVHVTAGLIDPGFSGKITLELKNLGNNTIRIPAGSSIGQLTMVKLDKPAHVSYGHESIGSKYQGQDTVQAAR